jgi:hypothetical protein
MSVSSKQRKPVADVQPVLPLGAEGDELSPQDKAFHLEQAESIFKHPELHVTLDEPNPSKQQYSVQQLTQLWNWYKQEMTKHIDNFDEDLKNPMEPKERAELHALANRLGWVGGPQTGREDLHPHAYKYKKLKDYDTLKKASKFRTPAEREAELAAAGAPLDVIPAAAIDGTPVEVAAAHEAAFREQQELEEEELRMEAQARRMASYSEDSEWWPSWEHPKYEDMPSQPFLQQIVEMLATKKLEAAAAAAAVDKADEDSNDPVLWRALPIELDPFVMTRPDHEGYQLVLGTQFRGAPTDSAQPQQQQQQQQQQRRKLSESQQAFLVSAAAVLGFSAYRWLRRKFRRARQQPAPL